MREVLVVWLIAWAVLAVGCGGTAASSWSERIEPDRRYRDSEHHAVVRVGGFCSGTLISTRHVLTAAHCMDRRPRGPTPAARMPLPLPAVRIHGRAVEALRCAIHPDAYPGFTGCQGRPNQPVATARDLAILELAEDVGIDPMPILLDRSEAAPSSLWLVGWHRRPERMGELHRYAGLTQLVGAGRGVLMVESTGLTASDGYMTHRGNSGGPALMDKDGRVSVVGVLSSHHFARPQRSFYAATAEARNGAWIRKEINR